ncbi:TPR repeat protein [Martelella mangrovi]|uniref:TPR repeat protein n=2 Tax=Martelella mangrovi TaxID=1397477 RepID=A0ABV2IDV6_9HYPH
MIQKTGHRQIGVFLVMASLMIGYSLTRPVHAFDITTDVPKDSGRFDLFRFGFKAYKNGDKKKAVEAYRYAAEKGHTGSRWALANMYADGDGVPENDYEAFKAYAEIVNQDVEPGSPDTGFYVNALLALAGYYQTGIPDTPVAKDLGQARQLYFQAASVFGNPEAQFRLAEMILKGDGGAKNVRLAKKWLNLSRKNGNVGAMAVFGDLVFNEGQSVLGLAYLTMAADRCGPSECHWIRELQEKCFSVVDESDRRGAIALAQNMSTSNP